MALHIFIYQCIFQKNNGHKEEVKAKLPANQTTPGGSTGTLRHSHKKSRPAPPPPPLALSNGGVELEIREPSQLLVGVPATLTTQWRHRPHSLVTGHVSYLASVSQSQATDVEYNYVGKVPCRLFVI